MSGSAAQGRRSREPLLAVLALAVLGAVTILASTQTWITAAVSGSRPVVVAGSAAAPALAPLALALLALAAVLGIAGRAARIVLAIVAVLCGAGIVAVALPAITDAVGAAAGRVTAATGIAGAASVRATVTGTSTTPWPVVALVAGTLTFLAGPAIAVRSPRWPVGGRRFRAAAPAPVATTDPVEEWDALTKGDDPTAVPPPDGAGGTRT